MHNAKCPVKCHTQSTKSTAFCKYAYHPIGYHALYDKILMHGVHQMVILTQIKPIAAVFFTYAWHLNYTLDLTTTAGHIVNKHISYGN